MLKTASSPPQVIIPIFNPSSCSLATWQENPKTDQLSPHQARTHCGPSFLVNANKIPSGTRRGDLGYVNAESVCQVIHAGRRRDIWHS